MQTPYVSVVIPVYNSKTYLKEAIESIIKQTFTNWEIIAINEYGSNDGSKEIIQGYAKQDNRIQLIQNETRLGLADSLNKGIQLAKGKYIARMDADDLSHPTRLEKQVNFMDADPGIGICGTYQHHFGPEIDWIHKPPVTAEECKANLLFDCDLCHSTLMLRKEVFIVNSLFYDNNYLAEDFELWTRAAAVTKIMNIPEVLGEYRWGDDNITVSKKKQLASENAIIVANALNRNLGLTIPSDKYVLLEGWRNPFREEKNLSIRKKMYQEFRDMLIKIYNRNREVKFYDEQALLNIMAAKWRNVKYLEPRNVKRDVTSLNEIFNKWYIPNVKIMWEHYMLKYPWCIRIKKIKRHISSR